MKYLVQILVILIIVSCGGEGKKRIKKPDNLITKDKMVDVIYDMSLVSAAKGVNRKLMEQQGVHPDQYVYEKHGIDSLQFAESNEYYAFDLDAYDEIYKKVKAKLEKDKMYYTELVQKEDSQRDSINKERRKMRDSLKEQRVLGEIKVKDKVLLGRIKNVDSLKRSRNRQN
jgi:galactokinase/mevalonate kinase-like predicted kinase